MVVMKTKMMEMVMRMARMMVMMIVVVNEVEDR